MKVIAGILDTRTNNEDLAITPYLFAVWVNNTETKICGLGICWGYYGGFLGIGLNLPSSYPRFRNFLKKEAQP